MTEMQPHPKRAVPQSPANKPVKCRICGNPVLRANSTYVNGLFMCMECAAATKNAEKDAKGGASNFGMGLLGGVLGAVLSGILWGLIVKWTNYEIGYVAIGVGLFTGVGVLIFSGHKAGLHLQITAAAASILGIAIGKYMSFFFVIHQVLAENPKIPQEFIDSLTLFSGSTVKFMFDSADHVFGGYDIIWVALAVAAAFKIPSFVRNEKGLIVPPQKADIAAPRKLDVKGAEPEDAP